MAVNGGILISMAPDFVFLKDTNGDDYEGLTWLSDTPKPSKSTLDGLWQEVQDLIQTEKQAKAAQKAALLERLGISEDEARLLLA